MTHTRLSTIKTVLKEKRMNVVAAVMGVAAILLGVMAAVRPCNAWASSGTVDSITQGECVCFTLAATIGFVGSFFTTYDACQHYVSLRRASGAVVG
jgi:hypothetical protein